MADWYKNFVELEGSEKKGIDYDIQVKKQASRVAIIAPHGGEIEPFTTEIAARMAGDDHSFYSFVGLRPDRPHGDLHITSARFDEPACLQLISNCDVVVAIHGRRDGGDTHTIFLGGLDIRLRNAISTELLKAEFVAQSEGHKFPGRMKQNICNRGQRRRGVQLELPRTLRGHLCSQPERLDKLADAVRRACATE